MQLHDGATASPAATRIFERRAQDLARPTHAAIPAGDLHLIARVGSQRVAVPITSLRSVAPVPPITRLSMEGELLTGLIALAGEVVEVVDLARLLGIHSSNEPDRLIMVVQDGDASLALTVDGVDGQEALLPYLIDRIDLSDAERLAPASIATPVGRDGLLALDVSALLADPRLSPPGARSADGGSPE